MALGLEWQLILELLLLGCVTGFLAGLLGVGGGMMMVPFITLLLTAKDFPPEHVIKMAVATSLATICFTSIASVRAQHARGAVRWDIFRLLTPGIVVGSMLGAQLAKWLPAATLALLFAAFVGFSATQMLRDIKPKPTRQLPGTPGMLAAGAVIGLLAALVGAGGAFVSVPFMVASNVAIHTAVGTSAALGFPIALAGTIGYVIAGWSLTGMPAGTLGFLYLPALLVVSLASVAMAPVGVRTAHRLNVRHLRRMFALLLYGLAGYMLMKGLG
ncbi:sulfite exporter TauE/SafE family protein [Piscinibacter sakaiensis]|uniref:sulfite exporter TauE/SafE family protein n=1 Tax=Piscinibacter sakaiensis TaxID=1547922 RepID=UPI003AAD24A8